MAAIDTSAGPIGAMLHTGATYQVPPYQRDYSWTNEEVQRFWEDLVDTIDQGRIDYFIGSMVINDSDPQHLELIDGQQRLTTVSLLLCALRDLLVDKGNSALSVRLASDFLDRTDYATGKQVPRIRLNKTNRQFYEEKILLRISRSDLANLSKLRTTNKSNRRLANAYIYLFDKLADRVHTGTSSEVLLGQITKALDAQISTIQIRVKESYDAYLLFETLNDRGLALSVADLLKSYIFSRCDSSDIREVQENWEDMVRQLGDTDVKSFIRHFWLSTEGVVRDKALYREITQKSFSQPELLVFSRRLKESATTYGLFSQPHDSQWDIFDPTDLEKVRNALIEIQVFGVKQYYPLLLAAFEKNITVFPDVTKFVANFSFRYSIIGGEGPGNIEKAVSNASKFVRANPTCSAQEIFDHFKSLYPNDADFKASFSQKQITNSELARHILAKINNHLLADSGMATIASGTIMNVEHILPKKVTAAWISAFGQPKEIVDDYVDFVGNMTLLLGKSNKAISNSPFSEKKAKGYSLKPLKITEPLLSCAEWNAAEIEKRQAWFADLAIQIWK
jgi:hypothetical protein